MMLAIDRVTGKIVGQVTHDWIPLNVPGWSLPAKDHRYMRLLTKDGYVNVDAASVRLEEVR